VLLLTATGAPLVYYGDEVGMEGAEDPDSRRCMEWDPAKQDARLLSTHRALIRARRERPWLSWGAFEDVAVDDERHIYAYRRSSTGPLASEDPPHDELYVAINTGDFPTDVCLPAGERTDLLSGKRASGGVTVGARDAAVLVPA
jgi:glycosidase